METIYIPQLLKMPEQTMKIKLCDRISGLTTLIPVKGIFQVRHGGNFLELQLQADTILTLTCDRCLQTFNYRLKVDTSEIIYLKYEAELDQYYPPEREITGEDLWESLPPDGELIIEEWIYQQLSLAIPLRSLCSNDCQPPGKTSTDNNKNDQRWSALANLKSLMDN
ncbi:DUF177 domain-containing protein [Cyanobacterium sp. Dongsha4]|uniref:YceD family protein n=1 Tax=Cyanobacterium sp. DS4 TaxID=2878255 RepID=UPI002E80395E|nr:DUF177 domain-containing protein [Cyanobacterium sp. Dongsha4]WVL02061.1 DUF177 domain-containing protein [Cyanobacterium sp. Dongsha4]